MSFAVTAKLICAFVFAYADCWFSHEAAQLSTNHFDKVINKKTALFKHSLLKTSLQIGADSVQVCVVI